MKKPENLETSHDVLIEKPENFFANFSQSVQKIFSKKVAEISPKLDYLGIFEFLENKEKTQEEKIEFIKNLEKIDLENILPILENEKIADFHIFFIEKLDSIKLLVKDMVITKIPANHDFVNILKSEKILTISLNALLRLKNGNKYDLEILLPYMKYIRNDATRMYFVNRFLVEQQFEKVKKILWKFHKENEFIVIESLMQISGYFPIDEVKKILENPKIADGVKDIVAWKCEQNLDKWDILNFLSKNFENFSHIPRRLMLQKVIPNMTLEEWGQVLETENKYLWVDAFVLLDRNISEVEIEKFLQEKKVNRDILEWIALYRQKNWKNIMTWYNGEGIWERDADIKWLRKNMASDNSMGSYIGFLFSMKMREQPEKNIYDFYRDSARFFLSKFPEIPEVERQENNKNLTKYQKTFLSDMDILRAKNIGINTERFDLTIYIRYEHRVDFPEIAELMTVCIDEYIASGRSKYFSNIRILPRNAIKEVNIYPFLHSLKTAKYFNVLGLDAPVVMHTFANCIYLSHSANAGKFGIPSIISASMKKKEWDIQSSFELEAPKNMPEELKRLQESDVFEIVREVIQNLQQLEKNLDSILEKKKLDK